MNGKSAWAIIKERFNHFSEDRTLRLAAATAYYSIFSIGPLLVLIVGVAGLVFGEGTVRKELERQLQSLVGQNPARIVGSMMSAQHKGDSLLATVIGGAALVLGASGVFGQLQDSLNTIWGVMPKPGESFWALIRARFFSLATVLGIGFLLIISMALSAFVNSFAHQIGSLMSLPTWVVPAVDGLVSFAIISVLFGLIFKVLPDVKTPWKYVWLGGVVTALLFTIGKFLLSFYLSRLASASAYGAGSAVIIVLLYIYYSSIIVYVGAEFTRAYALHIGPGIQPSHYAVQLTDRERAVQGIPRRGQVEAAARDVQQPAHAQTHNAPAEHATAIHRRSPGDRIRARPYAFVSFALSVGLTMGVIWRAKGLRHALRTFRQLRV